MRKKDHLELYLMLKILQKKNMIAPFTYIVLWKKILVYCGTTPWPQFLPTTRNLKKNNPFFTLQSQFYIRFMWIWHIYSMLLIYYISKGNCVCLYKHPGGKLGTISFLRAVLLVPTNLAEPFPGWKGYWRKLCGSTSTGIHHCFPLIPFFLEMLLYFMPNKKKPVSSREKISTVSSI